MKREKKAIHASPKKMVVVAATAKEGSSINLYDKDFFKWASTQSKLLRHGDYFKLDIQHLIEEIEALGRSEKRALESYLEVLLMHMLKEKYLPEAKTKSWELSIRNSRLRVRKLLKENPSLKPKLSAMVSDAYESARLDAALETGLDEKIFPEECPWAAQELF